MVELRIARIVGAAAESNWAQVHVFPTTKRTSGESYRELGQLLAVVEVGKAQEEEVETQIVGRELLQRVHEEYFGGEAESLGERLERIEKKVGEEFGLVAFEVVVGVVINETLAATGFTSREEGGGVALWREGSLGFIARSLKKGGVFSGELKVGDRLLLASEAFYRLVEREVLGRILASGTLEEAGEQLAAVVHGQGESAGVAGLLAEVQEVSLQTGGEESEDQAEGVQELGEKKKGNLGRVLNWVKQKLREGNWQGGLNLVNRWTARRGGKRKSLNEEPQVYLKQPKRRRLAASVTVVLLGLLLVSVGLGWRKRVTEAREIAFQTLASPIKEKVGLAETTKATNPLKARSLLAEARSETEEALTNKVLNDNEKQLLRDLLTKIESFYQELAREWKINEALLYFDLALVRNDFFGQKMTIRGDEVLVLDTKRQAVAAVGLTSKKARVMGGGKLLKGARLIAASAKRVAVLADLGVVEVADEADKTALLVEKEEGWRELRAMGNFGGNIYLLDAGANELWRYPGTVEGVGAAQRWLGAEVKPDFSQVVDMVIDGDVWVLSEKQVVRYRRGAALPFQVAGLVEPIEAAAAMDTLPEGDLFILDKGRKRVVVTTKEGEYKEQYLWDGLGAVSDIKVVKTDEGKLKMLLLAGASIFEIPVKDEDG